jgi:DNA-binding transcriptional ArsR family regulator/uncharacterized protein YndB with AHSA1/START domain
MDAIFKALNDPARRAILDALRDRDGQTLSELEARFAMTRFGVMKHLRVLEDAGLVTTRRRGRFKDHYLNAIPLQEVIDRWIEPLIAKPAARAVIGLKARLEGRTMDQTTLTKPAYVMTTFIRCSRDALWDALSNPDAAPHYHFMSARSELSGDTMTHYFPDGSEMLICRMLEAQPKSRIVTTFEPKWHAEAGTSRVVYLIEEEGAHCKLTVEHYDLGPEASGVADGWARWSAGLKTWLETGQDAHFARQQAPAGA